MKTVILAGGYGTRIRDVSQDIPKPMIPIGSHPILWHIMKHYSYYGVKNFVLCLGYKSEIIKEYFVRYQLRQNDFTMDLKSQNIQYHTDDIVEEWKITFAETGLNAFTGARVFRIKQYVEQDDYFLLTYGDGVGNVNIQELISFHKSHGKLITVTGAHPPGRFGELEIQQNQVVGFNEKPQATEGWISAGYFVCNRQVFDYLTNEETLILEREPLERLVRDEQMMVYKHEGFWQPMDTYRDYQYLNDVWEKNAAPWRVW